VSWPGVWAGLRPLRRHGRAPEWRYRRPIQSKAGLPRPGARSLAPRAGRVLSGRREV